MHLNSLLVSLLHIAQCHMHLYVHMKNKLEIIDLDVVECKTYVRMISYFKDASAIQGICCALEANILAAAIIM